MLIQSAMKQIDNLLQQVDKLAEQELIKLARQVMKKHPHLKEFVIAMGTFFFKDKHGNIVNTVDWAGNTFKYFEPLNKFISKYDKQLCLTGIGMRFKVEGDICYNW